MDESALQPVLDQEHLRLLRIGYFIQGGVTVFFSLFGLMYIFMGLLFAYVASHSSGNPSVRALFSDGDAA